MDRPEVEEPPFSKPVVQEDEESLAKGDAWLSRVKERSLWRRFSLFESTSIDPVPPEEQKQKHWWNVALLWLSANINVLTFSTGMLAPSFDLGVLPAIFTVLGFALPAAVLPAACLLFGPKLGMRQVVMSRYSLDYIGSCIAGLFCAITQIGYCTVNLMVGGSTLQAVSPHRSMSATVGIVIIAVISFAISFLGIRAVHWIESTLWFPIVICFVILIGVTGTGQEGLHVVHPAPKATAKGVLGFGCVAAGYQFAWASMASDISLYVPRDVNTYMLFLWVSLAFAVSTTPVMMLGAAFSTVAQGIPSWKKAYDESYSPGELLDLVLAGHVGNFGKFIVVLFALSSLGVVVPASYSFGIACQTFLPVLANLPRFIFSVIALAIMLPLAIVGQSRFYDTLNDFVSVIAYWYALFVGIVLTEHFVFRHGNYRSYDVSVWRDWRRLPYGVAGIGSAVLSLGLLIPCIDQDWFTGPIAKHAGDLGFEVGLVLSSVLYCFLRPLEKRMFH